MAIRDWHTGQLVIFWVVIAAVQWVLWTVANEVGPDLSTGGFVAMIVALVSLPVAALIVTWKWFGGHR